MSKDNKNNNNKKSNSVDVAKQKSTKIIEKITPCIDWVLKIIAGLFVLTTSFLYVRDWLQANQVNTDFSLAGAILILSVALYLIVRKR